MPTKAELKQKASQPKMKIRRGDRVMIVAGKDKGQVGEVISVSPKLGKVYVAQRSEENPEEFVPLNAATKHRKARMQGEKSARIRIPVPIDASNLMVLDPKTNEPTRIGRKLVDGKVVRYAKKSGTVLEDKPAEAKK